MARGFLSGIVWGGVIGLGVVTVASVLAPMPGSPVISDAAPGDVQAPERVTTASSGETGSTQDRKLITGQAAAPVAAPDPDTTTAVSTDAQTTADQPETGQAAGLQAPTTVADAGGVTVGADAPVLPTPQALAPMAPQPADDVSINTEPAAPPQPVAVPIAGAFEDPAQPKAGSTEEIALAINTTPPADATPAAPAAPAAPSTSSDTLAPTVADQQTAAVPSPQDQAPQTAQEVIAAFTEGVQVKPLPSAVTIVTQETAPAPEARAETPQAAPQPDTAPVVLTEAVEPQTDTPANQEETTAQPQGALTAEVAEATNGPPSTTPAAPVAEVATDNAPVDLLPAEQPTTAEAAPTETAPQPQPQATAPSEQSTAVVRRVIGTPSITLTERNTGVTVNRPGSAEETPTSLVTVVSELPEGSDQPPIKRYAQSYERPTDKPLMSIVLIDDGSARLSGTNGVAALRSFPYPLTFAVDTSLKDAAERMALYRREGQEVMAMIDLPQGALPSDAETTLGAILPVMSDVVGVLEGTRGGLQGSRDVADQVTAILAQTGHGLVTQDKGLNTMPKLARKEGVPADPVFRDFDSKGQTSQVIRRFLDQAAFKAGQEGAVVMLGRVRPETVEALLLWGLQDRASSVGLAPISAVLLREE